MEHATKPDLCRRRHVGVAPLIQPSACHKLLATDRRQNVSAGIDPVRTWNWATCAHAMPSPAEIPASCLSTEFMMRVRACTMRCQRHKSSRRFRFLPTRHGYLRKTVFDQQTQDRLRILELRLLLPYPLGCGSRPRLLSTPQTATRTAVVRTSGRAHWPPFPYVLSDPPQHDNASQPLRDVSAVFLATFRSQYPLKRFAETRAEIY